MQLPLFALTRYYEAEKYGSAGTQELISITTSLEV